MVLGFRASSVWGCRRGVALDWVLGWGVQCNQKVLEGEPEVGRDLEAMWESQKIRRTLFWGP